MIRSTALMALAAALLGLTSCWFPRANRPVPTAGAGAGTAATGPHLTESQVQRLEDAKTAMELGAYESALSLFQSILAENPTITTAYLGIGDIRMAMGEHEAAEPAYARATRIEPRSFDAQYGHGRALFMMSRWVDAVRAFHRALTIQPDSAPANMSLATTYLHMQEWESAVVFAERGATLDPGNGRARANLGAAYENLGRHAEAIEEYLVAIELLDDPSPVMMNLINCFSKERRYQETINTAENLIRSQPSPNAYERLGWARFKLRLFDDSVDAYRSAVRMDPSHWPSLNGIGVNSLNRWLLSGKTDAEAQKDARDAFRRSIRANSDQPEVIRLMAHYSLR